MPSFFVAVRSFVHSPCSLVPFGVARSLLDAMGEYGVSASPIMVFSDTYATFSCLINDLRYIILLSLVQWPRGAGNQRFGRIVCKMLKGQGVKTAGGASPVAAHPSRVFAARRTGPRQKKGGYGLLYY